MRSPTGVDEKRPELKAEYGDCIAFWGGGYAFPTIHNVVAKVPAENLVAMYQAVKDFRGI